MKPKKKAKPAPVKRRRPNIIVTMSPEGLAELDARAAEAGLGRGAFIEQLLRATA